MKNFRVITFGTLRRLIRICNLSQQKGKNVSFVHFSKEVMRWSNQINPNGLGLPVVLKQK